MKRLAESSWRNDENSSFYETLPEETFRDLVARSGLARNDDLDLIYPEIAAARSLLEIGSGFGRVLEYLIQHGFGGHIYSFERTPAYVELLKERYRSKVAIRQQDILEPSDHASFDVILWLWAGLAEFSPVEQEEALAIVHGMLAPGGALYVDMPHLASVHARERAGQSFTVREDGREIHVHVATPGELVERCDKLGFAAMSSRRYHTSTGQTRYMLRLGK